MFTARPSPTIPESNARLKDTRLSWGLRGAVEMEPGAWDPHVDVVKRLVEPAFATLVLVVVVVAVKVLVFLVVEIFVLVDVV